MVKLFLVSPVPTLPRREGSAAARLSPPFLPGPHAYTSFAQHNTERLWYDTLQWKSARAQAATVWDSGGSS
jgi:hypothetical protein